MRFLFNMRTFSLFMLKKMISLIRVKCLQARNSKFTKNWEGKTITRKCSVPEPDYVNCPV